jgi:hypothetical protein
MTRIDTVKQIEEQSSSSFLMDFHSVNNDIDETMMQSEMMIAQPVVEGELVEGKSIDKDREGKFRIRDITKREGSR